MLTRRLFLHALFRTAALAAASGCVRAMNVGKGRKVVVVGGGMAGLAAARELTRYGFAVVVLEGRDRVGGRVWTDRSLGVPVDLGASWIHESTGNPIHTLAKQLNVTTKETDYAKIHLYDANGSKVSDDALEGVMGDWEGLLGEAESWAEERSQDVSVRAALDAVLTGRTLSTFEQRAVAWRVGALESESGEDLENVSLWGDDEETGHFGGDKLFPGGYDQIINGVADGLDVRTSQRVATVKQTAGGVTITTDNGTFDGDFAIVTVPLGVLKAGSITFDPALPAAKTAAIGALGMGTLNKIAMRFASQFWPSGRDFLGALRSDTTARDFGVFLDWSLHSSQPVLMAFSGGTLARSLSSEADDQVKVRIHAVLKRMFGTSTPVPTQMKVTRWNTDPFALGSYSHLPVGVAGAERDALAAPHDRVFFAGEATTRLYPATVHGAYVSGLREAKRISRL